MVIRRPYAAKSLDRKVARTLKRKSVTKKHKARDGRYSHWHWKGGKRLVLEENEKRKVYYPWRNGEELAIIAQAYNATGEVDENYEDRASRRHYRPHPEGCGYKSCDSCWAVYAW